MSSSWACMHQSCFYVLNPKLTTLLLFDDTCPTSLVVLCINILFHEVSTVPKLRYQDFQNTLNLILYYLCTQLKHCRALNLSLKDNPIRPTLITSFSLTGFDHFSPLQAASVLRNIKAHAGVAEV